MEKLAAHAPPGFLHRAFSVMLVDDEQRVLLQQRAMSKYHFGGRWTNTCCSHPGPGDDLIAVARSRLGFEMGVDSADLRPIGSFEYRATDRRSGLVEHELDHVLMGATSGSPTPNPDEVADSRWVRLDAIRTELSGAPDDFTPWFPLVLDVVDRHLAGRRGAR